MDAPHSPSLAQPPVIIAGYPVFATLLSFPVACFTLTLLTDVAYWQTSNVMWQNFSAWLLFTGLVFGALAALACVLEFLFRSRSRVQRPAWPHLIGGLIVLGLAFVNSLFHAGDGWTAVVPYGLILSAVTVLLMLVVRLLGPTMVLRRHAGERT